MQRDDFDGSDYDMIKPNLFQIFPRFIVNDETGYAMCKALEAGYNYFLDKIEKGVNLILNPDEMPEWRLDEMAWEYNIPYDYRADVEQKREWVRNAIPMYRILGTKEGIRQYLTGYFGEIEIQENWEYGGDPFHFRVTVGGEWTPETEAWTVEAVNRACELVELFGCGEVIGGVIDVKEELPAPKRIPFRPDWINAFLGTDIPEADMREYFRRLELEVDDETGEVIAPTFRQDLEAEADIAEEVARMYGYDNIPTTLPKGSSTMGGLPLNLRVQERLQDVAEYCGFSQSMTYSFESPKVYDKLRLPEDHPLRKAVVISNPLYDFETAAAGSWLVSETDRLTAFAAVRSCGMMASLASPTPHFASIARTTSSATSFASALSASRGEPLAVKPADFSTPLFSICFFLSGARESSLQKRFSSSKFG